VGDSEKRGCEKEKKKIKENKRKNTRKSSLFETYSNNQVYNHNY